MSDCPARCLLCVFAQALRGAQPSLLASSELVQPADSEREGRAPEVSRSRLRRNWGDSSTQCPARTTQIASTGQQQPPAPQEVVLEEVKVDRREARLGDARAPRQPRQAPDAASGLRRMSRRAFGSSGGAGWARLDQGPDAPVKMGGEREGRGRDDERIQLQLAGGWERRRARERTCVGEGRARPRRRWCLLLSAPWCSGPQAGGKEHGRSFRLASRTSSCGVRAEASSARPRYAAMNALRWASDGYLQAGDGACQSTQAANSKALAGAASRVTAGG